MLKVECGKKLWFCSNFWQPLFFQHHFSNVRILTLERFILDRKFWRPVCFQHELCVIVNLFLLPGSTVVLKMLNRQKNYFFFSLSRFTTLDGLLRTTSMSTRPNWKGALSNLSTSDEMRLIEMNRWFGQMFEITLKSRIIIKFVLILIDFKNKWIDRPERRKNSEKNIC